MTNTPDNIVNLDTPRLGQGNITFNIGDEEFVLKPSVHAMQSLSRQFGGLQPVLEALQILNFDAIVAVVIAGLGNHYSNPKVRQELTEKLFEAGISDDTGRIQNACARFVLTLTRGGRPIDDLAAYVQQGQQGTGSGNPPSSS
jgi:hypothetical protein